MTPKFHITLLSAILASSGFVFAADPSPTTKPAAAAPAAPADEDMVIGRTRLQDMKATNYLYKSADTTLNTISGTIQQLMEPMTAAIQEGKLHPMAAPIFIYHGITQDRDKVFTIDVGFPVSPETKAWNDFKVRQLDTFRCAGALYSGPVAQIHQGFQQVFTDLFTLGLESNGDVREMYLYWEGPESPNNVIWIGAGVK